MPTEPPFAPATELPEGEAHLWRARLPLDAAELARCDALLSADERRRAGLARAAAERARFVAVRGLLRTLLGRYLDLPPQALRFAYGEHGKPTLADEGLARSLRFNVSHAGDVALLAFARGREVGVDVERVREVPRAERIAGRVLRPAALEQWRALAGEARLEAFFREWTRLEAAAKLHGDGVWRTLIRQAQHRALERACWFELAPLPGYVGGLAVEGEGVRMRDFAWGGNTSDEL